MEGAGAVALANAALEACADADAVLLSSDAVVPTAWLERLRDAAGSDSIVATASALGPGRGPLSIGPGALPIDPRHLERVAAEVGSRASRARPRTATADGRCVWISRAALELEGKLDEGFESLRAALIDLSQRCALRGFANVAADDVIVGSASPEADTGTEQLAAGRDGALLQERYPYLLPALEPETWQPLQRSLASARRALGPLRVTIDARIVRGSFSGAHAQTLEVIETLARLPDVRVRVVLDPAIGPDALAALDRLPGVERVAAGDVSAATERDDVAHRPYQVTSPEDLDLLSQLGERLVITHLDLIAFHNPGYFDTHDSWLAHRRVTRQGLAMADRVVFLSEHAARDAIREGLVERGRARVVPMAVSRDRHTPGGRRPEGVPDRPFLLCLGNDFRHKNRLFAIKLLAELQGRAWDGDLVLAGARVEHGSSRSEEASYLSSRPGLAATVHDLPAVDEAEKAWLYANAAAVAYPTVLEGFGLIPFEAASAGTPCIFARQASLAELLPPEAASIVPWDAAESAERALPLLLDAEARRRHLELVAEAGRALGDWQSIGRELLAVYEETAGLPSREASSLAAEATRQESKLEAWNLLERGLTPRARTGLLALAQRRRLRRPLSWLLAGLYRVAGRAGRGDADGRGGRR